ncbi:Aste57867_21728 [Aphanomyces stellatus]|uniref:Aste57867_21728 protein n=1 Tax=Aphanomyces stellatus TaxID=120398 RepID=A0A485LIY1_9STRA|nr:hypothetical protein As57867_021659 [Aphanomyces stellatus]VFT98397.1 Aste57867_21728 [Aphanomyces stellatus]
MAEYTKNMSPVVHADIDGQFATSVSQGQVDDVQVSLQRWPLLIHSPLLWPAVLQFVASPTSSGVLLRLLDCLHQFHVPFDALVAKRLLVHAGAHGVSPSGMDHLVASSKSRLPRCFLSVDIFGVLPLLAALQHQHHELAHHVVERMDHGALNQYGGYLALRAIWSANEDVALRCLGLPHIQARLDAPRNEQVNDDEWARANADMIEWAVEAVTSRLHRVVRCLETQERLRRYIHQACYLSPDFEAWGSECDRYRAYKTWCHYRDPFLVQRRRVGLPDHVGLHIAKFVFEFDADADAQVDLCANCGASLILCPCHNVQRFRDGDGKPVFGCCACQCTIEKFPTECERYKRGFRQTEPIKGPLVPVDGARGTGYVPYKSVPEMCTDTSFVYQSISRMDEYSHKSAEELRFEDYLKVDRPSSTYIPSYNFAEYSGV